MKIFKILTLMLFLLLVFSAYTNFSLNSKINEIEYRAEYTKNILKDFRNDILDSYENKITDWETTRYNLDLLDKQTSLFGENN